VTDDEVSAFDGKWAGPEEAARLIADCERTVTF
jgi:hypothetical protein